MMRQKLVLEILVMILFCWSCNKPTQQTEQTSRADIDGLIELSQNLQFASPDTALTIARTALELSETFEYIPGSAKSHLLMGNLLYQMGGFSQASSHLNTAQNLFQSLGIEEEKANALILQSKVNQRSGNLDQAFEYMNQALFIYQKLGDKHGLANVYGNFGHLFEKAHLYDSALKYQKNAMDLYSEVGDSLGLADIYNNIGSIHEDLAEINNSQSDYDKAYTHFQQALLLNQSINNQISIIINLNNLGDILRKKKEYNRALPFTQKALALARETSQKYQIRSACRDLSKLYQSLGDDKLALMYLEESYQLTDGIFNEQMAVEISKTQAIYGLEQKQQRILLLEKERKFNQSMMLLSSSAAVVVLLLSLLIIYQRRSKNIKKRKLLETEAELVKAELENTRLNEQKLKTELENKMLREDQLRHELELKSKSLTKSALHMIQKNEFLQVIRKKLKELKKVDDDTINRRIKKLVKSIDFNFNLDDDWQEFETIFQQVHSDFFLQLKEHYPNLTPSEVRLCAMIRLNLHSKDMAAIMGISQDSLRISRYRLRKRLGLNKGANLYSYIINIG